MTQMLLIKCVCFPSCVLEVLEAYGTRIHLNLLYDGFHTISIIWKHSTHKHFHKRTWTISQFKRVILAQGPC